MSGRSNTKRVRMEKTIMAIIKRGVILILMLSLVLSMSACKQKEEDPYIPSHNTEGATTEIRIEDGNVVAKGVSDYFEAVITYVFDDLGYAYTLSETVYSEESHALVAYENAQAMGNSEDVLIEGNRVSFRADDSYVFEGMSLETAANYLLYAVLF